MRPIAKNGSAKTFLGVLRRKRSRAGFGLLTLHDIPKPTYRAFRFLHRLGTKLCLVDGLHKTVNVWVVSDEQRLTVLISNHALPGHTIDSEIVSMRLLNCPEPHASWIERIDEDHANPQRVWREMGSPGYLSDDEVGRLKAASESVRGRQRCGYEDSTISFEISLPPHSVAGVELEFAQRLPG